MGYALLTFALVALDQAVKYMVVETVPFEGHVELIPKVVELTYLQNTGAAFSLFADHTWLLAVVSFVMSVALAVAIWKNLFRHPLGKLTLTLLLAGAIGNFIDRAFRGYVVDMFNLLFVNFAVFNVADMCVVVGGVAAGLYYLFLADRLEGVPEEEPADGNPETDR